MNRTLTTRKALARAFTLIELLVVITIIAVLASLLVPASNHVMTRAKKVRVQGELNQLDSLINSYKLELNEYPPDNGTLVTAIDDAQRHDRAAKNPLFYELSGAVFENTNGAQQFRTKNEVISVSTLQTQFNVNGIRNSARRQADIPYKGASFKSSQYRELAGAADVEILAVPVKQAPFTLAGKDAPINPWFYDSSTTNRHNRQSFDLWAEIMIGKKTNIIGNWNE